MKRNFFLIILILITSNSFSQNDSKVKIGKEAYNIIGTDENGNKIELLDYKGKFVLLNFTATNCGPCWKVYPILNRIQEEYQNQIKVISIHFDNNRDEWNEIAKGNKINFKCTSIFVAKDKSIIFEKYGIDRFPYFYLLNRKGIVIKKWFGNQEVKTIKNLRKYLKP